jgi:hypothetical protein
LQKSELDRLGWVVGDPLDHANKLIERDPVAWDREEFGGVAGGPARVGNV